MRTIAGMVRGEGDGADTRRDAGGDDAEKISGRLRPFPLPVCTPIQSTHYPHCHERMGRGSGRRIVRIPALLLGLASGWRISLRIPAPLTRKAQELAILPLEWQEWPCAAGREPQPATRPGPYPKYRRDNGPSGTAEERPALRRPDSARASQPERGQH